MPPPPTRETLTGRFVAEPLEPRLCLSAAVLEGSVFLDPQQSGEVTAATTTPLAGRNVYVDLSGAGVRQPGDP